MTTSKKKKFLKQSASVAFDLKHRETIRYNISKYDAAFEFGKQRYQRLESAKKCVSQIKRYSVANLASLLEEFETDRKSTRLNSSH